MIIKHVVTKTAKTWGELPKVAREDAIALIRGERLMWNPKLKDWDDTALPFCRMRWLSLGLALKELSKKRKRR